MRRRRKTKILATLGPASSSPERIRALFEAGVDVFRINMSHTDHDMLRRLVASLGDVPESLLVTVKGEPIRLTAAELLRQVRDSLDR